jgi:serine/threonine-protein kinase
MKLEIGSRLRTLQRVTRPDGYRPLDGGLITTTDPTLLAQRSYQLGEQRYLITGQMEGGLSYIYWLLDEKMGIPRVGKVAKAEPISLIEKASQVQERFDLLNYAIEREAILLGMLNHVNIVGAVDYLVHEVNGVLLGMMIMPFFSPEEGWLDVGAWSDRFPKGLNLSDTFKIIGDLISAILYARSKGVINRDIKPANILFSPLVNKSVLIDFGIANKVFEQKKGMSYGTLRYASPEVFGLSFSEDGKTPRDLETEDVFNIGLILFQLIVGHPFLESEFPDGIVAKLQIAGERSNFEKLQISQPLKDVLSRCLQTQAANRFQSLAGLQQELTYIAETFPQLNEFQRPRLIETFRDTNLPKSHPLSDSITTPPLEDPTYYLEAQPL